ncbi:MAG: lysine--tRNA ligase [Candidatus Omnitrophota bacterium]
MSETSRIVKERLEKIKQFRTEGKSLYGGRFCVSGSIKDIIAEFEIGKKVSIAGRLMAIRAHGKSIFSDLKDGSGKLQIYCKIDIIGEEAFNFFAKLDIGDIVGIEGELFKSRTGEITVKVDSFQLLSKIVQTLPEKWHGLKDVEIRYRQRYLDLIANPHARAVLEKRSAIITRMRSFLSGKGFIEVETPILQPIPGGAKAEPFCTHHNALHCDLYLRVAPELYLKKLLVGGFDKVFEIGKNFRNEGISVRHNPEFTMLELYQSYADYTDMMELTEELITLLVKDINGEEEIPYGEKRINFTRPWKRIRFYDALKEKTGVDFRKRKAADVVRADKKLAGKFNKEFEEADFLDLAFDEYVLTDLVNPTFVTDYPVFMTPLAKRKEDDPELVYRFELFINNMELANAYSELNDPFDQRERFEEQRETLNKDKKIDEDFLTALEHGMPPAGGLGIGIDRLIMLLTNSHSIRDVILFPQLRPEKHEEECSTNT